MDNLKDELCIFKYTNKNNFSNYFFGPNVSIKISSAKITWMDSKSISFTFEKTGDKSQINLLELLKKINNYLLILYNKYKDSRGHILLKEQPCIFYEKDNVFFVKCNLPNVNGKYLITNSDDTKFYKPLLNTIYKSVILDVRNIWETGCKCGYRLELKVVEK